MVTLNRWVIDPDRLVQSMKSGHGGRNVLYYLCLLSRSDGKLCKPSNYVEISIGLRSDQTTRSTAPPFPPPPHLDSLDHLLRPSYSVISRCPHHPCSCIPNLRYALYFDTCLPEVDILRPTPPSQHPADQHGARPPHMLMPTIARCAVMPSPEDRQHGRAPVHTLDR